MLDKNVLQIGTIYQSDSVYDIMPILDPATSSAKVESTRSKSLYNSDLNLHATYKRRAPSNAESDKEIVDYGMLTEVPSLIIR